MDTLTHGIAGALVARSILDERQGRGATLALTLGSVFPDSDVFSNFFIADRLARLEVHRGLTHSVVALPFWALLLGGLTCLVIRRNRWWFFSCLYGMGIALHIFMDLITSFGTMIWSPLSKARVAWDTTFIIDLVFTSIVLLPLLTAWVYSDRQRALRRGWIVWFGLTLAGAGAAWLAASLRIPLSAGTVAAASVVIAALLVLPSWKGRGFRWRSASYCRLGVAALAVYLTLCFAAHRAALSQVREFAGEKQLTVLRLAALPAPPSLWRWSGLVQTPDGVYRLPIDLGHPDAPGSEYYANSERTEYSEKAANSERVKTYLWFARFPWVTYRENNGFHIIEYRDIQFFWPPRGQTPPFTFQVFFDPEGRVVRSELIDP